MACTYKHLEMVKFLAPMHYRRYQQEIKDGQRSGKYVINDNGFIAIPTDCFSCYAIEASRNGSVEILEYLMSLGANNYYDIWYTALRLDKRKIVVLLRDRGFLTKQQIEKSLI
jgi:hypothetical protein